MLINVAAAMDLPAVDERWTSWCPKSPASGGTDQAPLETNHVETNHEPVAAR
jgi:hypothetical protein